MAIDTIRYNPNVELSTGTCVAGVQYAFWIILKVTHHTMCPGWHKKRHMVVPMEWWPLVKPGTDTSSGMGRWWARVGGVGRGGGSMMLSPGWREACIKALHGHYRWQKWHQCPWLESAFPISF